MKKKLTKKRKILNKKNIMFTITIMIFSLIILGITLATLGHFNIL